MNQQWFSAAELAGMPGVPQTKSATIRMAKREGWQSRARAGRGGGREYLFSSLPEATRLHFAAQATSEALATNAGQAAERIARRLTINAAVDAEAAKRAGEAGLAEYARLTGNGRLRADAKLAILDALAEFQRHTNLCATAARQKFVVAYNDGEITLPEAVAGVIPTICCGTLYRWQKTTQRTGIARLGGAYGNRKGSGKIERQPELLKFCLAALTAKPHATAKLIHDAIGAHFDAADIDMPSRKSVERWLKGWKADNKQLFTAIANPDAYKSRYMPAFGSASEDITRLNQRWELDSTAADVMLTDGRHSIVGCIDVFCRRSMLHVSKSSTAAAVASVLRRAILDWGVPESIKNDNGSDYISNHIKRVVDGLQIEQLLCHPFSGWEKPHIERFFRTFSHDLVEALPGYIGHNVAERSAIEARQAFSDRLFQRDKVIEIEMSSAELQAFCDRWLANIYHRNVHSALGVSPLVKAAGQACRRIENVRALDILLAQGGTPTVGKKGIRFQNGLYIAPELGDWIGEKVLIRFDEESDMGELLVFGGPDLEFICIAQDPSITGVSRKEVAAATRAKRTRQVENARRELKAAARKLDTRHIAEEILAQKEAEARKITPLRGPAEAYDTPALSAAADAARADGARDAEPEIPPVDEAATARLKAELAEAQAAAAAPNAADERFRKWYALRDTTPTGDDATWLPKYETSIEFKARKDLLDEFGPEAMGLV